MTGKTEPQAERYQVRAPDAESFAQVEALAVGHAKIRVRNPKRRSLSIEEPEPGLLEEIERCGARVTAEFKYDPDVD